MWWRPEAFGAWVRLGDGALVAVDHQLRARLGLDPSREHPAIPAPLEAHVAVTGRCDAGCKECYLEASPEGVQPDARRLLATLHELASMAVSTIAFGGGEPMMRPDLALLAREARRLRMVPVTTTSGRHLTDHDLEELSSFAQINVSHPGLAGSGAASEAEHAVQLLSRHRIHAGVNIIVSPANLAHLKTIALHLRELGISELQLLRFKPAGRGLALAQHYELNAHHRAQLCELVRELSETSGMGVRIDCSMVPLLHDLLVDPSHAERLSALGLFGCEAGRNLVGVDLQGGLVPCSCWRSGASAGDWQAGAELQAIRLWHAGLAEPCLSCRVRTWCRGGCQVVSRAKFGGFSPDPGCPRVQSHTAADRSVGPR